MLRTSSWPNLATVRDRSPNRTAFRVGGKARIASASVHTLHYAAATYMDKKGTKRDIVKQVLGHASLTTTFLYVYVELARDVTDSDLQENAL